MSLTRAEQEIVAVWDAEVRVWWVASTYPPMVKKLRRLAAQYGLAVETQGPGVRVKGLPTVAVSFRRPRRPSNRPSSRLVARRRDSDESGVDSTTRGRAEP